MVGRIEGCCENGPEHITLEVISLCGYRKGVATEEAWSQNCEEVISDYIQVNSSVELVEYFTTIRL